MVELNKKLKNQRRNFNKNKVMFKDNFKDNRYTGGK